MASNPYVNKVDLANGTTLIDLSQDTATQADVAQGKYFHLPTGERVQGTGENDFIITVSYNSTTQMWEPDCTFAEYQTARSAGKTITVQTDNPDNASADGTYYGPTGLEYIVRQYVSRDSYHGQNRAATHEKGYEFTANGTEIDYDDVYVSPSGNLSINQNGTGIDVAAYASVNVAVPSPSAGTEGTPVATKGTVSNHQVTVTPSVTNVGGVIQGGTHSGTPVTVSASELVSGSETKTANGTYDVTNLASLVVNVPGTVFPLFFTFSADKTQVNFTTSYDDAKAAGQNNARFVFVNEGDDANGRYTGIHTGGWQFEGTTFTEGMSFDLQDWDDGIYSVAWGYVNGVLTTKTRKSFPVGNLAITQNGNNIDVDGYSTVSVNVSGGSSKNAQAVTSTTRVTSTSLTACSGTITVAKTGTYDVYWSTHRTSTSGTWSSRLYVNNTASGTEQTSGWSNHVQPIHLTGVSLTAGQTIRVYAKSRGSNYYAYVPLLTIIET